MVGFCKWALLCLLWDTNWIFILVKRAPCFKGLYPVFYAQSSIIVPTVILSNISFIKYYKSLILKNWFTYVNQLPFTLMESLSAASDINMDAAGKQLNNRIIHSFSSYLTTKPLPVYYKEEVVLYFKNFTEPISALCGSSADYLSVIQCVYIQFHCRCSRSFDRFRWNQAFFVITG